MTPMQHTPSHAAMPKRSHQQPHPGEASRLVAGQLRGIARDRKVPCPPYRNWTGRYARRYGPSGRGTHPSGRGHAPPAALAVADSPTGSLPVRSPGASPAGTGPQRVVGPGTGPHRLVTPGSGTQPTLSPGSGAQPALGPAGSPGAPGRTPTRGFPPARDPPESPTRSFSPWHTPTGPLPVQDDGDAYPPDDGGFPEQPPPGGPAAPAGRRRGGGRTRRRTRSRVAWIAVAAVIAAGAGFAGYK